MDQIMMFAVSSSESLCVKMLHDIVLRGYS